MLKPPDLSKINRILFFTFLSAAILYFGREFFILIAFPAFLAMLMTPVSNLLERYHLSRIISSLISVLIIIAVIAGVFMLLSSQIVSLSEEFPMIMVKAEQIVHSIQKWLNDTLGISSGTLASQASEALSRTGAFITGLIKGTFSLIGEFLLIIVFTFLFLLHREKYEKFIVMLHPAEKRVDAEKVVGKISKIAQHYLAGRLISIAFLSVLYLAGFLVIGLKNALLLAILAAIVTFIPYAGPVLGGFAPFFMAIVSGSLNQAFWVVIIISAAQLLDNYFIEPYVVGGSVNISPFFAIFILIVGGVLWGIAGVILFLPLLGIVKIIFENVEGLQPYAFLIGDQKESPAPEAIWQRIKKLFKVKRRS